MRAGLPRPAGVLRDRPPKDSRSSSSEHRIVSGRKGGLPFRTVDRDPRVEWFLLDLLYPTPPACRAFLRQCRPKRELLELSLLDLEDFFSLLPTVPFAVTAQSFVFPLSRGNDVYKPMLYWRNSTDGLPCRAVARRHAGNALAGYSQRGLHIRFAKLLSNRRNDIAANIPWHPEGGQFRPKT